jgi:hypothetical protein
MNNMTNEIIFGAKRPGVDLASRLWIEYSGCMS